MSNTFVYSAIRGSSGYSGLTGNTGVQGAQGAKGSTGVQGAQGAAGTNGIQGAQGAAGAGAQGVSGYSGFSGAIGAQGTNGTVGSNGAQGASGYSGFSGLKGSTGAQGTAGSNGAQGAQGAQGASGYSGFSGAFAGTGVSGYGAMFTGTNSLSANSFFFSGGNVGIGTTSPVQKLEVNGNIFIDNGNSVYFGNSGNTASAKINCFGGGSLGLYAYSTLSLECYEGSYVTIPLTTASTSTTTGALTVAGGVGIAGAINAGGNITGGTSISTNSSSTGYVTMYSSGNTTNTGYVGFFASNGTRQGYIGYGNGTNGSDAGNINYQAGSHNFAGTIYDNANSSYYLKPSSTSVLNTVQIANRNVRNSGTIDLTSNAYSVSAWYPVTFYLNTERTTRIRIENALNTNVPSWSTHAAGFSIIVDWEVNGSGWGTIPVSRKINNYVEAFTSVQICGGISQMIYSSEEVIWLRGGGLYNYENDGHANCLAVPHSATYTGNGGQTVSPVSGTSVNNIYGAVVGTTSQGTGYFLNSVGIGTSSPLGVLNVHADSSDPVVWITRADNVPGNSSTLRLGNNNATYKNSSPFVRAVEQTGISQYNLTFGTSNAADAVERLRIDYTGNVGIGTSSPAYTLDLSGSARIVTSLGVGTTPSGTTGEIRATGNITAYYSDDRLKTKLGVIENSLDKICSLEGFYYEANETAQALGYEPVREVGISAQATQKVLPEIVAPAPIDEKYLTVRYERLAPLLIEAIKELREEVKALK